MLSHFLRRYELLLLEVLILDLVYLLLSRCHFVTEALCTFIEDFLVPLVSFWDQPAQVLTPNFTLYLSALSSQQFASFWLR